MARKNRRRHDPRPLIAALWLFQRGLTTDEQADVLDESEEDDAGRGRVRCPLCGWRPASSSRWYCADCGPPEFFYGGCGSVWNTFDTRGVCPGCNHRWRWTSCLYCAGWSPHEDWYAPADKDD